MDLLTCLYETYRDEVFRYLLGLTKDGQLAEELLSETFVMAVRGIPDFRGDSQLRTWLFTIARNKWYDHLRRTRVAPDTEVLARLYLEDRMPDPGDMVWRKMTLERFWTLLDMEEPRTRKIVLMRIEGRSFHEIAEAMGIRENSARVLDFRARKRIREKLLEEGYDGTLRL